MSTRALKFEPLVDITTLAQLLSVGTDFLYKLVARRRIRFHRLGTRMLRFRPNEVLEDLEGMRKRGRPRVI